MLNKTSYKQVFIWNFIGSLCNSLVSFILLMVAARLLNNKNGDIFSIAWSISQMMLTIGTFQVRVFQATDTKKQYLFKNYYTFRLVSLTAMVIVSAGYIIIKGYSPYKALIVMIFCLYRVVDAFADVFEGFFQQNERLDLAGKALTVRVTCSAVAFFVMLITTRNLLFGSIAMVVTSSICVLLTDVIWQKKLYNILSESKNKTDNVTEKKDKIKIQLELLNKCYPLFINAFCIMIIYNAAKIAIDNSVESGKLFEGAVKLYTVLFMPAFVINLFLIILRPLITRMAIIFGEKSLSEFKKMVLKIVGIIFCLSIIVIVGGTIVGLPVLSIMYNIKLSKYRVEFILILAGGGVNAMMNITDNVMTIMRRQHLLLIPYLITTLLTTIVTPILVNRYKIMGAAVSYFSSMLVLFILIYILYMICIRRIEKKRQSSSL